LDGLTRIPDLVAKCKATGMPAVAVTDHGNMFGIMELYDQCEKTNWAVKPILGCEVYVAPRSRFDRKLNSATDHSEGMEDCIDPSGRRDAGYHLVLLAKNIVGFKNLSKLVSKGFTEGFYYKPRVDKALLCENSEGIIALSACLGGEIQAMLMLGQVAAAERITREYKDIFGDDFYLEIQNQGLEAELKIIPLQIELSRVTGVPLVATNDAHYLNHEDSDLQDTLLCIGTKTTKSNKNRMSFTSDQFYVKTPEEMNALWPNNPEFITRSLEIAAKIEHYPITRKPITPKFPAPDGFTLDSYFVHVSREWFEKRIKECKHLWYQGILKHTEADYRARLEFELETILKMGYPGYFLLVWDFIAKSREMGVPVGPGRGSAAGSIVAWSLGITDIDPMQYGLLFERFLNPERVSMPDVDIDFCRDGRQKIIDYVTEKYGIDRVSNIITIGKLKTKSVIKDVSRVYGRDIAWSNALTKLIPNVSPDPDKKITISNCLGWVDELGRLYHADPDVKEILDIASKLEGLTRNTGVHAAGVIIAPEDITNFVPLFMNKDNRVMSQFTMMDIERVGLLKMDFLGLETLTQIAKTQGYISQRYGKTVDTININSFNDKQTFDIFSNGDTDGVFQFESPGMKTLLKKLQPDRFEDLIALNALFRPGPLGAGMGDIYINRRHGREPIVYIFDELEPILAPTYGVILYQEQVMQIAQVIAGFSLGEADMLRRAMGKKDMKKMTIEKAGFINKGIERGFDGEKVAELFELILYFAGYGFNKSHSAAYAMIAYQTAYLKAHYRTEFMAGLLSTKSQRLEDIVKYVYSCRDIGIQVLGPDINQSDLDFTITEDDNIRFGLTAIRGLGESSLGHIIQVRQQCGKFTDFINAIKHIKSNKVNRKVLECLIKAGTFDSMEPNRAFLLDELTKTIESASKVSFNHGATCLFSEDEMSAVCELPPSATQWTTKERLRNEREALGFYVSGHPLEEFFGCIKMHTVGGISVLKDYISDGLVNDRDEVTLGVMVSSVILKTSQKGNAYAILQLEDMTDRIEAMVFNSANKKKSSPFELFKHLLVEDAMLRVTGELRIEASNDDSEEDSPVTLKLFISNVEMLEEFNSKWC